MSGKQLDLQFRREVEAGIISTEDILKHGDGKDDQRIENKEGLLTIPEEIRYLAAEQI